VEKYYRKGLKTCLSGRIQTRNYTNREGVKVYVTEVVVEDLEFAESKNASAGSPAGGFGGDYQSQPAGRPAPSEAADGFMNIPDGIDEELPFN
jgi:single-strand DNA-binding protein